MAKKKTTKKTTAKKKTTRKKAAKKKTTKKKATTKKQTKKKTAKKQSATKQAASKKVDPLEEAKGELHDSVRNAVKAFAHIANATEREAIDGLLAVAPESAGSRKKLLKRKKKLEQGDTESIASDILTQIRGALKSHKIDLGDGSSDSSKSRDMKKD